MQSIGPVLNICSAMASTNDNVTETFVICEQVTDNGDLVSQIVMELWEVGSGPLDEAQQLGWTVVPLQSGVCHTFQWRLEYQEDLEEHEEALDPRKLIHNFPDDFIDEATRAVNSWLTKEYAAMTSEVQ